jgi:hypothetical protein
LVFSGDFGGKEGINNGMGLKNALHVPQQIVKPYLLFVNDSKTFISIFNLCSIFLNS